MNHQNEDENFLHPDETSCSCCGAWKEVAGWDCHLGGYICNDCMDDLRTAFIHLKRAHIEPPKILMPPTK